MAKKFKVEIVTPEKIVLSEEADSLIVPAERGYLGVMAGRAPILCTLLPGEIVLRRDGKDFNYATSGGFMEVTFQKASLLTESAEPVAQIEVSRAEQARDRAKERLSSQDEGIDRERAKASLERAENRLRIASKHKP
jgi:F-type H+-transporting ATPase subunit epsilon